MLQPTLLAAATVALANVVAADSSATSFPGLSGLLNAAEAQAHKFLGLNTCPSPAFAPASCVNGKPPSFPGLDPCCTNVPGGYFLSTQFWDSDPPTGPNNSWTLHGLWPDNCDGTFDQFCDPARQYTNIRSILAQNAPKQLLEYMNVYWKDYQGDDESFWAHEWDKHGTCISTLNTTCYGKYYKQYEEVVDYFERAVELFRSLPTYDWLAADGIVPSTNQTYTLAQLQAVAKKHHGYEAIWGCTKQGALDEVWYGYITKGPVNGGKFIPTSPDGSKSSCPDTGIHYYPKGYVPPATGGSTGGSGNSTGGAFFNVFVNGTQNGCLISKGTWYTTGTCATYRLTPTAGDLASGFTMTSSKGPCAVLNDTLSCATGNAASTFTLDSDKYLSYAGSSTFYAQEVASGSVQESVLTTSAPVSLKIQYAPQ
ncbi:Ribonuclease T2-like [Rhodotorula toruloides]